jgi:hypothetical protein
MWTGFLIAGCVLGGLVLGVLGMYAVWVWYLFHDWAKR